MGRSLHVLIVDDNKDDAALVVRLLKQGGFSTNYLRVDTRVNLIHALKRETWDVAIAAYSLPDLIAIEVPELVRELARHDTPVIFLSGSIGDTAAADLMKAGAADCIINEHAADRLCAAVKREVDGARNRRKSRLAKEKDDGNPLLLSQVISSLADPAYVKDANRKFVSVNKSFRELLGVAQPHKLLGKIGDRIGPKDLARRRREAEISVMATGEALERVERIDDRGEPRRWRSVCVTPVRDRKGQIQGLVSLSRDITEQRRQEAAKQQFITTVSHELRTPVTAIIGALKLLMSGKVAPIPESAVWLLETAGSNSKRLLELINDILDIEKLEAGMLPFRMQRFDLKALAKNEIKDIHGLAHPKGVRIEISAHAAECSVYADRRRLGQAISNLLANAIRFSPKDGTVLVDIKRVDGRALLFVFNRGGSIPARDKRRIFDKFVQVDGDPALNAQGTGLGLPIAKYIVENMGGTLRFHNAPGGGVVFRITLPRSDVAADTTDQSRKEADRDTRQGVDSRP